MITGEIKKKLDNSELKRVKKELSKVLYKISSMAAECMSCQKLLIELRQEQQRLEDSLDALRRQKE